MPIPKALSIELSSRQRRVLKRLCQARSKTPKRLWDRCQIVLGAAEGRSNAELSRQLGLRHQTVREWRTRFAQGLQALHNAEQAGANDADYTKLLIKTLSDQPKSGRPPTFTPHQLAQIIAIACEKPEDSGRPVDRWTPPELAAEAKKRGIVNSISPRHVDRLLKGGLSDRTSADTG